MKLLALWLLVMLPGVFLFQQNEFEIIYERLEVIRYNTSYVRFFNTHNFKYNRTHAATNLTVYYKKSLGNELVVEVQSYKFASNEYRLFPIRFMFNFCDYASRNEFGLGEMLQNCGDCNNQCPMRKGCWHTCNWAPNSTKFPPHLPQGSYKHDLKFFYRSTECYFLQGYGTVKYPEIQKMKFF